MMMIANKINNGILDEDLDTPPTKYIAINPIMPIRNPLRRNRKISSSGKPTVASVYTRNNRCGITPKRKPVRPYFVFLVIREYYNKLKMV
ncbi:MAG: hypothetical protein Q7K45_02510 [Nanoarchaeota archaeon]|nr:hypothetical protein [Nanoarchaeota archaeon]